MNTLLDWVSLITGWENGGMDYGMTAVVVLGLHTAQANLISLHWQHFDRAVLIFFRSMQRNT